MAARILFFDGSFAPIIARIADRLENIDRFVLLSGGDGEAETLGLETLPYEALLGAESGDGFAWPLVDEDAGALLCYTSGTTGHPKGVLYSQRSIVLHALAAGLPGTMNFGAFEVILPCSSLYHAGGWGLPYSAPINGCALVLAGDRADPVTLHELITNEGVTFSCGVPTIWTAYLAHLDKIGDEARHLARA